MNTFDNQTRRQKMKNMATACALSCVLVTTPVVADEHGDNSNVSDPVIASCNQLLQQTALDRHATCFHYVDAFVAGASMYDGMLVNHIREDHKEHSRFLERAYRTRLGSAQSAEHLSNQAPYCTPDNLAHKQIVEVVIRVIPPNLESRGQLNDHIAKTLTNKYPCS